jgi:Cu(I)/Ag(I) efflux system membrane protein CusA/SilA
MQRIAAPLIGGLTSALILTLLVLPAIYTIWRGDFGFKKVAKEKV